jgi:mycobactin peptide synthetase MbtE
LSAFNSGSNILHRLGVDAPADSHEQDMEAIEKRYGVSRNAFFSLTTLLAIALYNKKSNIQFSWTYNGRDDLQKLAETGLLLKDLPLALRLKKKDTIKELSANIQEQIHQGIAHSCCPYTLINATAVEDDSVCFLYQQGIRDGGDLEQLNVEMVDVQQNEAASENALDVQMLDGKDGLTLVLDYAASLYDEKSVARFRDIFLAVASSLYELCNNEKATIGKPIHQAEKKVHENTFFLTWIKAK